MKKSVLLAIFVIVIIAAPLNAQVNMSDAIELTRTVIETQRQAIIVANSDFTEEESQAFWPVYKEYRAGVDALIGRVFDVIQEYAEDWETMTDEKAQEMLNAYLAIEKEKLALKTECVRTLSEILPSKKVTRYIQIENKLDAVIQYDLAANIPLVSWQDDIAVDIAAPVAE